ncbi:hypothetical protein BC834DRAFT_673409 [Gloeopeniophorella convolvens]|nr:hypothetical protein BC834DRAFT_673409 [Gloeopeniophorella convolvens]
MGKIGSKGGLLNLGDIVLDAPTGPLRGVVGACSCWYFEVNDDGADSCCRWASRKLHKDAVRSGDPRQFGPPSRRADFWGLFTPSARRLHEGMAACLRGIRSAGRPTSLARLPSFDHRVALPHRNTLSTAPTPRGSFMRPLKAPDPTQRVDIFLRNPYTSPHNRGEPWFGRGYGEQEAASREYLFVDVESPHAVDSSACLLFLPRNPRARTRNRPRLPSIRTGSHLPVGYFRSTRSFPCVFPKWVNLSSFYFLFPR